MGDTMRDPRLAPKRGDITVSPNGERYHVLAASKGVVSWRCGSDGYSDSASIEDWQEWAANDQIERRAK